MTSASTYSAGTIYNHFKENKTHYRSLGHDSVGALECLVDPTDVRNVFLSVDSSLSCPLQGSRPEEAARAARV